MFYTFPTKNCLTSSLYFLPIGRLMPATMTLEHEKRWISSDLSCARQSKQAFSALAYRKRAWRGGWLFGERCVRFFFAKCLCLQFYSVPLQTQRFALQAINREWGENPRLSRSCDPLFAVQAYATDYFREGACNQTVSQKTCLALWH